MHPVQPEYGFYTDSACDLSHLVEEYEIDAAQETTLYFYQKNQKDYSNISFVLDDTNKYLSISTIKSPADDDIVQITVEKARTVH